MGTVRAAIRSSVGAGDVLPTPTGRGTFIVDSVGESELVLLLGEQQTRTVFHWDYLEGIPAFLRGHGWMLIGANRDVHNTAETLDGYLKRYVPRQVANYVAVLLERAGIVELDRQSPARVRVMTGS